MRPLPVRLLQQTTALLVPLRRLFADCTIPLQSPNTTTTTNKPGRKETGKVPLLPGPKKLDHYYHQVQENWILSHHYYYQIQKSWTLRTKKTENLLQIRHWLKY